MYVIYHQEGEKGSFAVVTLATGFEKSNDEINIIEVHYDSTKERCLTWVKEKYKKRGEYLIIADFNPTNNFSIIAKKLAEGEMNIQDIVIDPFIDYGWKDIEQMIKEEEGEQLIMEEFI